MCVTVKQQLGVWWMEASHLNEWPATLQNSGSPFCFSNSCHIGNFRSIYLKRAGVMFAFFSWYFGCWVCVRLLSFKIYVLSVTFTDLWAGTLLFGSLIFAWYISGGISVYSNYNTVPFRDGAISPLCLIFCWWWQTFGTSVIRGIRTCHTVNNCFMKVIKSLNVFSPTSIERRSQIRHGERVLCWW